MAVYAAGPFVVHMPCFRKTTMADRRSPFRRDRSPSGGSARPGRQDIGRNDRDRPLFAGYERVLLKALAGLWCAGAIEVSWRIVDTLRQKENLPPADGDYPTYVRGTSGISLATPLFRKDRKYWYRSNFKGQSTTGEARAWRRFLLSFFERCRFLTERPSAISSVAPSNASVARRTTFSIVGLCAAPGTPAAATNVHCGFTISG